MKKAYLFILISTIGCAIILAVVKIAISTLYMTGGAEYSQIVAQQQVYEKENVILKQKVLADTSYFTIASRAASLGFVYDDGKQRLTIGDTIPFAYKN